MIGHTLERMDISYSKISGMVLKLMKLCDITGGRLGSQELGKGSTVVALSPREYVQLVQQVIKEAVVHGEEHSGPLLRARLAVLLMDTSSSLQERIIRGIEVHFHACLPATP